MAGMTHTGGMSHNSRNRQMNDVDCNGKLSCEYSEDEDSSERLMRLYVKDKDKYSLINM